MIVVDTHALVWWVNGGGSGLSRIARTAIDREQRDGEIAISAISAWEIALLAARGRLALTMNVDLWLAHVARVNRVRFVPVDHLIAIAAVNLPGVLYRDPADRMIAATARHLGCALVTGDEKLRAYPHVQTIW